MVHTITVKNLRPQLPRVIDEVSDKFERYVITRRGKPRAVFLGIDDYESLLETIEILSDKSAVKRIKRAKKEIAQGKTVSLKSLRERLEGV